MVSIERTSKKYVKKYAADYDAKRRVQLRWKRENEIVARMLSDASGKILDCPVGTGRFFALYRGLPNVRQVTGIDVSEDMLRLAGKKIRGDDKIAVFQGHAVHMNFRPQEFDVAVCVRFLDLIDQRAMESVLTEICRLTRTRVVLTIRLGEHYVPKSNTATHSRRRFVALVRRLGYRVAEECPIFRQGWFVMRLERSA